VSSPLDSLLQSLQGPALKDMAGQVGADEASVRSAATAALPLLLAAMARNASTDEGARALHGAIQRDHDGSVLDNLSGFLRQGGAPADGAAILRHLLGARTPVAEGAVAKASGLDPAKVARLLAMLAPLVMGAAGKVQRQGGLAPNDLGRTLSAERDRALGGPGESSTAARILTGLLDRDGDGSVLDDAGNLLKGFLRGR
jgi:hypothetical protein